MIGENMIFWFLACTPDKDVDTSLAFVDPSTDGPHLVATRETQTSLSDGMTLPLQVWYPSSNPVSNLHAYDELLTGTASNGGTPDCTEHRPVVVFSHGNTGMRFQSYFLMEYLATHGFIVLAPDHVGNTIFDNDEERKPELIVRRPLDVAASFDWLLEQTDFSDCLDTDAGYAVIGHSFGGYTALAVSGAYLDTDVTESFCAEYGGWLCEHVAVIAETDGVGIHDNSDSRIWASVPMTPAALETLQGGIETVSIPTLVMAGSKDTLTSYEDVVAPIYESLTQDSKHLLTIQDAGHYSFTNACELVSSYPDCGEDHIPVDDAHQLINTTVTAFLQSVRGMEGLEEYMPYQDAALTWE
jgi:predicted dienelactone hydrolase